MSNVRTRQWKSIFSEPDPIMAWLSTPHGYYFFSDFGIRYEELIFKNTNDKNLYLSRILDKMVQDLGQWVTEYIRAIEIRKTELDSFELVVHYRNGKEAIKEIINDDYRKTK